jgi:hypothetical protein
MARTGLASKRIRKRLSNEEADGRQRQSDEHDGVHQGQGETIDDCDQMGSLHNLVSLICAFAAQVVESGSERTITAALLCLSICPHRFSIKLNIVYQYYISATQTRGQRRP